VAVVIFSQFSPNPAKSGILISDRTDETGYTWYKDLVEFSDFRNRESTTFVTDVQDLLHP
jgi:hypothetical protein